MMLRGGKQNQKYFIKVFTLKITLIALIVTPVCSEKGGGEKSEFF